MKTALFALATSVALIAFPAFAEDKIVLGCAVAENAAGQLNKVDPTCNFSNERVGSGTRVIMGDFDNNPVTPDTLGQIDA